MAEAEKEKPRDNSSSVCGREVEAELLDRVREVISGVNAAKHVDQVICALHSLALLLFPIDASLFSGSLDHKYPNQVLNATVPCENERGDWKHAFYCGSAFPSFARVLLYNVASDWLSCFPFSARTHIYDSFFVNGPSSETVQALVPVLLHRGTIEDVDFDSVCSNAERLLVLCLLEYEGVRYMARDFVESLKSRDYDSNMHKQGSLPFMSRVAQIVTSIPDKARPKAPIVLSSHLFFKNITIQLLDGAKERAIELYNRADVLKRPVMDSCFLFVGEIFARICRRGSSDILLAEVIPQILEHVRCCISLKNQSICPEFIESKSESHFWFTFIEVMKDPYAVERFSEELLRQLATKDVNDAEAYWILWMLFHRALEHQTTIRAMFVDKFLLWKVFPICCLRWILQFSVLKCPPYSNASVDDRNNADHLDTMQHLVGIWSKRQFVQSTPMEQQAYVTAAIGLSLEKMSKEELETSKNTLNSLLQGVSCRLESPIHLVRKMACSIALVFSKIVDPKNPLYLDEDSKEEIIDWEFGISTLQKKVPVNSFNVDITKNYLKASTDLLKGANGAIDHTEHKDAKSKTLINAKRELSGFKLVDPYEIIDPATLDDENSVDEDEDEDESKSCVSSDSSLQPYDLSDDETDLKRTFSQLSDVVAALRKSDDPDGVERALDVTEKLVRALPDELQYVSSDLAKVLVHIRCSDVTVEGEEESAEEKRHNALVALLVTCPFESLDSLNRLLYSPNVDVSQRILILDVLTDAAQELATARSVKVRNQQGRLISTISENQPWFLPSSKGPPGASEWKEVSETGTLLSYSHRYERELPSKPGQVKTGKSRKWSHELDNVQKNKVEWTKNDFPMYAAAFMLPAMQGFDKKRHGVDLLGSDFIVLGKLIYMLGVCMKCMAMHPEASALAPALLDMISSRGISHHVETYVRRAALFTASCILAALHPSYVASALVEGNHDICRGLEWIRTWALHITESDADVECSMMAMTCLRLHAEMALQASRSLESADYHTTNSDDLYSKLLKGTIKIPYSNMKYQI